VCVKNVSCVFSSRILFVSVSVSPTADAALFLSLSLAINITPTCRVARLPHKKAFKDKKIVSRFRGVIGKSATTLSAALLSLRPPGVLVDTWQHSNDNQRRAMCVWCVVCVLCVSVHKCVYMIYHIVKDVYSSFVHVVHVVRSFVRSCRSCRSCRSFMSSF